MGRTAPRGVPGLGGRSVVAVTTGGGHEPGDQSTVLGDDARLSGLDLLSENPKEVADPRGPILPAANAGPGVFRTSTGSPTPALIPIERNRSPE